MFELCTGLVLELCTWALRTAEWPILVPQGYSALFVSILLVIPKNRSLRWKLGGTAVKKPLVWSPLGLYKHVIILFTTFWPYQISSDVTHRSLCHV